MCHVFTFFIFQKRKRINKIKYYEPSYVFLDLAKVKLIYYHFSKRGEERGVYFKLILFFVKFNIITQDINR